MRDSARDRILIAEPGSFDPEARRLLERAGEVVLRETSREALRSAFEEFDAVWLRLRFRVDRGLLGPSPRTRVLATPVTGLDQLDLDACAELGVRVVSLRGETEFLRSVRATAEHALALVLALQRHLPEAALHVRRGGWDRDRFRGGELYEKTVGLVGVGRLGTLVAGYLRAFGARVLGYDPCVRVPGEVAEQVETLDELLGRSDIVSLHASYSPATHHLIDARAFALMRPGATLINTARGALVDTEALLAALRSGHLAGAALDVLEGEPDIDASHSVVRALTELPNLLVVPHLGGNTRESFTKTERFLAERVVRALAERAAKG